MKKLYMVNYLIQGEMQRMAMTSLVIALKYKAFLTQCGISSTVAEVTC